MTNNVQPTQTNIIGFEAFLLVRKRRIAGQAYNRAWSRVSSGDCSPQCVQLFATAKSERERALAISLLMTDSEIDAWCDVLEASMK